MLSTQIEKPENMPLQPSYLAKRCQNGRHPRVGGPFQVSLQPQRHTQKQNPLNAVLLTDKQVVEQCEKEINMYKKRVSGRMVGQVRKSGRISGNRRIPVQVRKERTKRERRGESKKKQKMNQSMLDEKKEEDQQTMVQCDVCDKWSYLSNGITEHPEPFKCDSCSSSSSGSGSGSDLVKNRKREGKWTEHEHARCIEGVRLYGKNWKKVAENVKSRTSTQCRTHWQKKSEEIIDAPICISSTASPGKANMRDMLAFKSKTFCKGTKIVTLWKNCDFNPSDRSDEWVATIMNKCRKGKGNDWYKIKYDKDGVVKHYQLEFATFGTMWKFGD